MQNIELLAPAKNLESGIAAIKCGADAVYIAAEKFGARSAAGNSLKDIEELINFAHKYRAKIYITLNTILKDDEIIHAVDLINKIYSIGADALIIQDMGLLEFDLPPIALFASTQSNNTTPAKVKFLENVGFQRVILARELSFNQIYNIKKETNIELEFFVHGSLCVSYSGQCYMSYASGGRSANRGCCAQPCRKKYTLVDSDKNIISENKYLLSLKDLNLSNHLSKLIDSGISSFKIEGRLKDTAYIKNIVSYYRQELDFVLNEKNLKKSSAGKSIINFSPNPRKTFNRGYTEYFVNEDNYKVASVNSPKSKGERIGNVLNANRDYFTIDSEIILNNADGICFFDENQVLKGTQINNVIGNKIYPESISGIKTNTVIYRNVDHEFLKILNNSKIERKIDVYIYLSQKNDELIFTAIDEDSVKAEIIIKNTCEIAKNADVATQNIKKQLSKLGDTIFSACGVEINLKETYFIPVKEINYIRRELIDKLEAERLKAYTVKSFKNNKNSICYPEKTLTYSENVLNNYAKDFYKRHGATEINPAAESGLNMKSQKVMTTKYCIKRQLDICSKTSDRKDFKEPLYIYDENNNKYLLKFDCSKCRMEVFSQ